MNNFVCYPVMIIKVEGKPFPSPKEVISSLLNTSEIVINIIFDKENETFKSVESLKSKDVPEIEYILVVIKYLKEFKA